MPTRWRVTRKASDAAQCFEGVLVALAVGAVLALAGGASAATIFVDTTADEIDFFPNGQCSLREAIMSANAVNWGDCVTGDHPGLDTVVVPAGTYVLSRAGSDEDLGLEGDLDLTDDVVIQGAGSAVTVIDAAGIDRVFEVTSGTSADIRDVRIQNGVRGIGSGGGIRSSGILTVTRSIISHNEATAGGGISVFGTTAGGDMTLTDSTVSHNRATVFSGGGIRVDNAEGSHTRTLVNSTVSGNVAAGDGGGIADLTTASVPIMTLTDSSVSGNFAGGNGGGIASTSRLIVSRTTLNGNAAIGRGGGIHFVDFESLTLTNVTLSSNFAGDEGGGIFSASFTGATLANSTVSGNLALTAADGITTGTSPMTLTNTIVADDCAGSGFSSDGGNLESPGDTCGLGGVGDQVNVTPLALNLGPLADNGGPILTHAILPGSVAIDAGLNIGCPAADQRGVPRPLDGDGNAVPQCDIGAVEVTQCGDGIDNDGDSAIDFGNDPQCVSFTDNSEACGFGPELALLLPGLMWLQRRRRAAAGPTQAAR